MVLNSAGTDTRGRVRMERRINPHVGMMRWCYNQLQWKSDRESKLQSQLLHIIRQDYDEKMLNAAI